MEPLDGIADSYDRGEKYLRWMKADADSEPGMSAQSTFKGQVMKYNGWERQHTPYDVTSIQFLNGIDGRVFHEKVAVTTAPAILSSGINAAAWRKFEVSQTKAWRDDGNNKHPAAGGTYTGGSNFQSRVIIMDTMDVNWPQFFSGKDCNGQPTNHPWPPLRDWNDLAFIEYNSKNPNAVAATGSAWKRAQFPSWFYLRPPTVPEKTIMNVKGVLAMYLISDLPAWPGITFPAGSYAYSRLLADPVVMNVVWYSIRHKAVYENTIIPSITFFDSGNEQNTWDPEAEKVVPSKVPSFLINLTRPNGDLDAAIEENKDFERKKNHGFTRHDQRGLLSSKKGPNWPNPMQPTIIGLPIAAGAPGPPGAQPGAAPPEGSQGWPGDQPGAAPPGGFGSRPDAAPWPASDDNEIPDWSQYPGGSY